MDLIIFDFEVFKYDTLLGAKIITGSNKGVFQSWDMDEIRCFYENHKFDLWIGHNNVAYDNLILEAIVEGKNPYQKSKQLIGAVGRPYCNLPLLSWDLMLQTLSPYSLKMTELCHGKNISETEVDFNLDRPLTESEKERTESYNRDDLNQTEENFLELKPKLDMRLSIINEFNLDMRSCLNITGTKLASIVLGAHSINGIEKMSIHPKRYPNLELKNEELKRFYLNGEFKNGSKLTINLCGEPHQIGQGGIHSAEKCCHYSKALYFDVSGYYNLTRINFDLLPRTLGEEGKKKYIDMYHEQLERKKKHDPRRSTYKTILLSVFGAMGNKYTEFYDPEKLLMVTMTGQLFIVDLLEKLEPYVKCIQSNTDGIIVSPYDWNDEEKILSIVKDWCERTGYIISPKTIYNIYQRDVNCYFYEEKENDPSSVHVVGEAVKMYKSTDKPILSLRFNAKEPCIYSYCIVDYFLSGIKPEDTIKKYSDNLELFQYICKKNSFDWTQSETILPDNTVEITKLQGVNRAFPSNDMETKTSVYKCRKEGKVKRAKVANIPDNVFIYDGDIIHDTDEIKKHIDWNYYKIRAYDKIKSFLRIPHIKDISI